MIEFLTLKPESFGLDISNLSLKIIKLKKRGRFFSLQSWGETELKQGIMEDGEIKDTAKLAEIIREGVKKVKGEQLGTKNVIASLPEKKAFLQVIQMPKMEKEELKKALPFEAENYIPLPVEKVYLDFLEIKPRKNHLNYSDVLIVAVPKKTIDPYLISFKKAGLNLQALEVESQSIARAVIKNEVSSFPVLIIDFGKTSASFIVFSGSSLRFTSSIPICSQKITESISRLLRVDLQEAEKLKIKYGLQGGKGEAKKVFEASRPIMLDLIKQIKKYIDYYHGHRAHERLELKKSGIKKIILCGRGANLKGFSGLLSVKLKMPVKIANPWINILPEPLKEVPGLSYKNSLGYTTALGLALRGIGEDFNS